jgi:hypothetical protein
MRFNHLVIFMAALLGALPAHAATEEEVRQQIEEVLGDVAGFEATIAEVSNAILTDDPDALAVVTEFPLGNSGEDVEDSEGLAERWDELFTEKVKNAMDAGRYDELIVTSEGVGVGGGEVWINRFCEDDACEKAHWALARVNN